MNDSELRNDIENKNVYRAVTNLNTAIENPQVNINSVTGVNIQETENNNYGNFNDDMSINQSDPFVNQEVVQDLASNDYDISNSTVSLNDSSDLDNQFNDSNFDNEQNVQSQFIPVNDNIADVKYDDSHLSERSNYVNEVTYKPTLKEKKKSFFNFNVTSEFKVILFICFILFISIMVIPYIFDFFWGLY